MMLPLQGFSVVEILHGLIVSVVLLLAVGMSATALAILFLVIREDFGRRKGK